MKLRPFLLTAVLFAVASCVSEYSEVDDSRITSVSFNIPPFLDEEGNIPTKGTYNTSDGYLYWETGDRIGIIPNKGCQIYFEVEQGGSKTTSFDGGAWNLKAGSSYWSYYPFIKDIDLDKNNIPIDFSGQVQTGNDSADHIGDIIAYYTGGTSSSTGALSFQYHHLGCILKTYASVPAGTYDRVVYSAASPVFLEHGHYDITASSPVLIAESSSDYVNEISLELENCTVEEGDELVTYLMTVPGAFANVPITVTIYQNGVPAFHYEVTKTSSKAGTVYAFRGTSPTMSNVQFEDANFKAYCVKYFDTDGDGEISIMEAGEVTVMNMLGICVLDSKSEDFDVVSKITTLNGLEYFTNLKEFSFLYREVGHLTFHFSPLNEADFSKNASLSLISIGFTSLSSLDVSKNTALTSLTCDFNQLSTLDVSNNTALTYLDCSSNLLTSLDVSNNTALTELYCVENQLTSLDVSNNTALTDLNCGNNQLTSLDVSKNTALTKLSCGNNQLTSLDVSKNTALTELYCVENQLTSLDVSNNIALEVLSCSNNQLTSLDVSNNTSLGRLECKNLLTSLDVSDNTALTYLECSANQLTSLDVSNNTALEVLSCSNNQLTSLDVSNNTALEVLACSNNQLTSLDVSNNTSLGRLECNNNLLTSLDVSKCAELIFLYCSPMIDPEGNNLLELLYIYEGQNIYGVTENRNSDNIPEETIIRLVPNDDDSPLEDPKDGGEWGWN